MEREVIRMTGDMLHGPDATGSITSGGSESCLMGIRGARNRAREVHPRITEPEMVVPLSAHPVFWKGADYFGVKLVRAPLRDDLELDADAYKDLITENTVLLVGTVPSMTLGMVDPIEELGPLAEERDINLHVDASSGGYFLPFAEMLGRPIPTPGCSEAVGHTSSPPSGSPGNRMWTSPYCDAPDAAVPRTSPRLKRREVPGGGAVGLRFP